MKANNIIHLHQESNVYQLIETYRDLDRQIKNLTVEKDAIAKELKEGYFAIHDSYTHEGRLLATYKAQMVKRFNQSLFKEENPHKYEAYVEEKEERRFLLK